jgi:hypothetical protein
LSNFIVSYDLNGRTPTHTEMDKHIAASGWVYGRILETVWYIKAAATVEQVLAYVGQILSENDRLMVVEGRAARFHNLLIKDETVVSTWNNRQAA